MMATRGILFQTNEWKILNQISAIVGCFSASIFDFVVANVEGFFLQSCFTCLFFFWIPSLIYFPLVVVVVLCVVRHLESKWPTFWQRQNRSR